jgi:cellobiose-specific phosphotransferase system component IIA
MKFTKESLMAMGVAEEMADKIMAAHTEAMKTFIPKTRLDEVIRERDENKRLLDESNSAIEDLKKVNPEELKTKITELQTELETAKTQSVEMLTKERLNASIKLSLAGQVHDADLVLSQLDVSRLTVKEDGMVDGLDSQVKDLREKKSFLFIQESDSNNGGLGGLRIIGKTPPEGSRDANGGSEGGTLGARLAKIKSAQNSQAARSEEHYFGKG